MKNILSLASCLLAVFGKHFLLEIYPNKTTIHQEREKFGEDRLNESYRINTKDTQGENMNGDYMIDYVDPLTHFTIPDKEKITTRRTLAGQATEKSTTISSGSKSATQDDEGKKSLNRIAESYFL